MRRAAVPLLALGLLFACSIAPAAEAKTRKLIVARQFEVPENAFGNTITGRLGVRGCFTSTFSNGKKVKCPGRAVEACTVNQAVRYSFHPGERQFVSTAAGGGFTVTIQSENPYEEVNFEVLTVRRQAKGLRLACFGALGTTFLQISSPGT